MLDLRVCSVGAGFRSIEFGSDTNGMFSFNLENGGRADCEPFISSNGLGLCIMVPELERYGLVPPLYWPAYPSLSGVCALGLYVYSVKFVFTGFCGGDMTAPKDMDVAEVED